MTVTERITTDRATSSARRIVRDRHPLAQAGRAGASVIMWVYAVVSIAPLLLMVSNSFRTTTQMAQNPLGLPTSLSLAAFEKAWVTADFSSYFLNSVLVTASSVLISTVVSLLAAYAIARSRLRFMRYIESLFISGLMLPVYLAILPIFYLLDAVGLISNLFGLTLVYAALGIPFSTFVLTTFVRQLPIELEEAARIDGAGPLRTFVNVMLPLVAPAIATVVVFRFVPIWNDFFYPLILLRDRDVYTLPVGLTRFFGEYQTDWPTLFAGLTLATLPLVVLFLIATRQIVSGLTAGMSK